MTTATPIRHNITDNIDIITTPVYKGGYLSFKETTCQLLVNPNRYDGFDICTATGDAVSCDGVGNLLFFGANGNGANIETPRIESLLDTLSTVYFLIEISTTPYTNGKPPITDDERGVVNLIETLDKRSGLSMTCAISFLLGVSYQEPTAN
jgi:hypothetical protein